MPFQPATVNITEARTQEALATLLESVEDHGIVLTDSKFSQTSAGLHELLTSQGEPRAKGWVLTWKALVGFEKDGNGCVVNLTFRYRLSRFHPYQNDGPDGVTSEEAFNSVIDKSIDALARDSYLSALGGDAEILSLASRGEFTTIDWVNSTHPDSSHFGEFDLDVKVQRTY